MTFMSFMKKESTRTAFEKQQNIYGTDRYGGHDPNKVTTDFDELKKIRNKEEHKNWKTLKLIFLIVGFVVVIFMLLNLFISLP